MSFATATHSFLESSATMKPSLHRPYAALKYTIQTLYQQHLFVGTLSQLRLRVMHIVEVACKSNLRHRLILNKGDKPYSTKDIVAKLHKVWKVSGHWRLLSLSRGFYEFSFASPVDLRTVWAASTVKLEPGVLQLFEWTKDFNIHT